MNAKYVLKLAHITNEENTLQQMSEYGEHDQYSEFDEDNECGHSFKATSRAL